MNTDLRMNLTDEETFFNALLLVLNVETNGVKVKNVAKIMAALETEFKKYPDGFAKHYGDDVADQDLLDGKSWKEILNGMSRDTFNNGFKKIGMICFSENHFNQIKNGEKAFGKGFYCRVRLKVNNRTFYYRNDILVNAVIKAYKEKLAKAMGDQVLALEK